MLNKKSFIIGISVVLPIFIASLIISSNPEFSQSVLGKNRTVTFDNLGYTANLESNSCETADSFSLFSKQELDEIAEKSDASLFRKPVEIFFSNTHVVYGADTDLVEGNYSIDVKNNGIAISIDKGCFSEEFRNRVQWTYSIKDDLPSFSQLELDVKEVDGFFKIYVDLLPLSLSPAGVFLRNWDLYFYKDPNMYFGTYATTINSPGKTTVDFNVLDNAHEINWSRVNAIMISISGYGSVELGAIKLLD